MLARWLCMLSVLVALATVARPVVLSAQRSVTPARQARASIDSFVVAVRDMAAWALVTPAAHIPVGGILDSVGEVATVVGARSETIFTPDSVLVSFRLALANAARRSTCQAIALAYMAHLVPPQGGMPIDAVVVEVEHRSGYRANIVFPYQRDEAQEPVFGSSFSRPGTLRALPGKRVLRRRA